ncbi:MAG: response regulator [Lentisphaeria bacterium]|nr:response regulator [Lentisphaeria bacterium]
MQYFFYSNIAGIALIVHLIINWRQLIDWKNGNSRPGYLDFRLFILSLLVFFVSDVLWGLFALWKFSRLIFYADTVLFFLSMMVSVCAWTRYVVNYLQMPRTLRQFLQWTGRGLLAFFILAMVANSFTDCFFTIDSRCEYHTGPVRQLALILLIGFNVLSSGMTMLKLLRTKGALHRRNLMVFAFGITMIGALALQLGDAYLPLYSIGCLFGSCFLHVFVVEEERNEMHRQELLAKNYGAQLETERAANQAKSLFFSTVSHDIRTPLNAIVGFSELLEKGVVDEAERARCISSIRTSGKMLARLVDDILDLSKMESGKLEFIEEPTHIPTLAREVIAVCEVARLNKSLELKTEIGEMPWVSVDPHRVRQLLFNLLSNAYKYTERGTVTVRVNWIGSTLTIEVQDTGKGISKANLERILQPFVQVADKNHRNGTGLGLPICRKLAALMGGELTVVSEVGVGSTFTIKLYNRRTVEPPEGASKSAGTSEHPGEANSPSRVLVVDDSSVNRAVLKAMLAKCGVTNVTMAENGREALEKLKADPAFDIVLSDLWMPEMDGRELVNAIRSEAKLAHLPVYLITADVEARGQAGADGFTDVLLKPVTLDKLRALLG